MREHVSAVAPRRALSTTILLATLTLLGVVRAADSPPAAAVPAPSDVGHTASTSRRCPPEMVRVHSFCVDRWEATMVDESTGQPLSPYYPPEPHLLREVWQAWDVDRVQFGNEGARNMPIPEISEWERTHSFRAKAVSVPSAVPQAYVAYPVAKRACEAAGKRLCTEGEWVLACKGQKGAKFPYGDDFDRGKCNVWGYVHPGVALHQGATFGHRDPRLNLVEEGGDKPFLRLTGATPSCASHWDDDAAYDMVGNVDEWVDGERPEFVGGFYARSTKGGCEARVTNHAPGYYDYSLGARCCKDR